MTKDEWIDAAAEHLKPLELPNPHEYAESLYDTYVDEGEDYENDPAGAVAEDMTYWND